ncbi:hypothetical protein GGF46_000879 [Coemansia sp. RSA 552]|nr:hypothetical protein GGF46_000879 [Coemansia sp. RSA 552]
MKLAWKITSLSSGERENLCDRQIQTCQNNCGGPDEAPMAFCNSDTMAWGCGCKTKTPDFKTWNWPVPAADCGGSADACRANCNSETEGRDKCFASCSDTHKCNTDDAPVSYTDMTSKPDDEPAYVGPAVSYRGDKLGDLNDGNDRTNVKAPGEEEDDESSSEGSSDDSDGGAAALAGSAGIAAVAVAAMFF